MAEGPAAGVRLVEQLEATDGFRGNHWLPSTRAELLRRLGHAQAAAAACREALHLAPSDADRRSLTRRLIEVGAGL